MKEKKTVKKLIKLNIIYLFAIIESYAHITFLISLLILIFFICILAMLLLHLFLFVCSNCCK